MRVFLDTNVIVSALATRGICADVLREVLASHELIISSPLITELKRVLHQKLRLPAELIKDVIELLQQDAYLSSPGELADLPIRDKSDVMMLSAALNGNVELFVTGDKELLDLGKVRNLEIVSPRMFWEKLKAQSRLKIHGI